MVVLGLDKKFDVSNQTNYIDVCAQFVFEKSCVFPKSKFISDY